MASSAGALACVFCGDTFPSRPLLQDHFRLHGDAKVDKQLNKATQYSDTHVVKCDICSQEFDCVSRAIHHQFKKHNDRDVRYFCPWCGKRFPIKYTFDAHVKIHADEIISDDNFKCEDCEVIFYKEDGLNYHRVSYHDNAIFVKKVNVPPPSKKIYINSCGDVQSTYYCHLCGQEYVVKYNLQRHIADIHGLDTCSVFTEIIKCNICEALFYNEKAYTYHNTFHKPTDMYVTDEEMRLNVVTKIDQDFDLRRVRTLFTDGNKGKMSQMSRKKMESLLERQKIENTEANISNSDKTHSRTINVSELEGNSKLENVKKTYERKSNSVIPKNAVLLGDFVNMNKDLFGLNDAKIIEVNEVEIEHQINIVDDDDLIGEIETSTDKSNIKVRNDLIDESTSADNDTPNSKLKSTNTKRKETVVKYLTREELDKLKSKGLIRLTSKPKSLIKMKKISIIDEQLQKKLDKDTPCSNSGKSQTTAAVNKDNKAADINITQKRKSLRSGTLQKHARSKKKKTG